MCEYVPRLLWWFAVPLKKGEDGFRGAKSLVKKPFETWQKVAEYIIPTDSNDVLLFAEDGAEPGLIQVKARLVRNGGQLFAILDKNQQLYELSYEAMINKYQMVRNDIVEPEDILYSIRLDGINESEGEVIVVTRDEPRKFYRLAVKSTV